MAGKADAKTSRCWPGFEPVPGKSEHEQGSCRKKPASQNGGREPDRERSRKKQVAAGGKRGAETKSKSPDASERKSVSKTHTRSKKAPAKKAPAKKAAAKKAPAKKTGGTTAKKTGGTRAKGSTASTRKKTTSAQ